MTKDGNNPSGNSRIAQTGLATQHYTRNYALNEVRNLQKKRSHCERPFLNIIPKDSGRQLKIKCSAGCYELLKNEIVKMTSSPDISVKFNIFFTTELVNDCKGYIPEMIIKATNRLSTGAPGKRKKFTVNMYHTQCSLLINGNSTPTFQDEILPILIKKLETNPQLSDLDRFYANIIDRCLSQSILNPEKQTSVCASPHKALVNDGCADSRQDDPYVQDLEQSKPENTEICIHCQNSVSSGIACDNCEHWYHFECE